MIDNLIVASIILAALAFAYAGSWVLYVALELLLNACRRQRP